MFDSSDSRRAAEFDSYRRELVLNSRTVSGEAREAWFKKLQELVTAMFPDAECNPRKPGLATRLFSVEVSLPQQDKMHLLDLATELDDNWRAAIKSHVKGGASCVYRDRLDAIWEWVVDLGDYYVTGHVKLRNFRFEGSSDNPGRPSYDRPQRPYQERRPYGDRPDRDRQPYGDRPDRERRPYNDRPNQDRRPYGGGGGGDRKPTFDRPRYPSDESRGSQPPRKPYGHGPSTPNKGYPKFGGAKKGPGRPKRKWSDG